MDKETAATVDITVVIPALNEATQLPRTLAAVHENLRGLRYRIIVVDNGSDDGTPELARTAGAAVLVSPNATIGALRNRGARHASGRVLLFLDADVCLTPEWRSRLPVALARLDEAAYVVTGSHCAPPEQGSWIERNWYSNLATQEKVAHLGTGHMLVKRDVFLEFEGFNESLRTGEDYEFCQRVRAAGGLIINDPALAVVHNGFPKNLGGFIRREAWHGTGDAQSWQTVLGSKVAISAVIFIVAHLLLIASFLLPAQEFAFIGLAVLVGLLVASSQRKYRKAPLAAQLINTVLFYFYYLGRAFALSRLPRRPNRRP